MNILVIDDDRLVRRTVEVMLKSGGHQVSTESDGRRGMERFRLEKPDIVVTDIIMPEQDGLVTITMIRRECVEAKIIAMSGGGRVDNVDVLEAALALGAADVIRKPFEARALLQRIDRLASGEIPVPAASEEDPGAVLGRLAERSRGAARTSQ
jgi:DNA-binding response OmpR family regulator